MSCKEPFRFAELIKPFRLNLVFEMTYDMTFGNEWPFDDLQMIIFYNFIGPMNISEPMI